MKASNPRRRGFTLLELVVVLAILAVIATLATREVGHVLEQERFDTSQRGLEAVESAILGTGGASPAAGAGAEACFVADLGRLPRAREEGGRLTLGELWANPGSAYDARPALQSYGVPAADEDPQVLVPGGWRGPYLRLPFGAAALRDGWGNPCESPAGSPPAGANGEGYARLRDAGDNPLTSAGQEIRIVRHLGANGLRDPADAGCDRDGSVAFSNEAARAGLKGHVDVLDGDSPAAADPADTVTVRVYGPDPEDAGRIRVWSTRQPFASNPVVWEIPAAAGLTIGPRVVRASFSDANGSGTSRFSKGAVKTVALKAGVNYLDLQVDR